jgi:hypothetical protein
MKVLNNFQRFLTKQFNIIHSFETHSSHQQITIETEEKIEAFMENSF